MENLPSCSAENKDTMECSVPLSEDEGIENSQGLPEGYNYKYSPEDLHTAESQRKRIVEFVIQKSEDIHSWIKEFEASAGIVLKTRTSSTNGTKYLLTKDLVCHHNTRGKTLITNKLHRTKNTLCPFTINIKVKKPYPGESECHCIVTINDKHNHNLKCAEYLSFLEPKEHVKEKFLKLFATGHSPSSALHAHHLDLMMSHEDSYDTVMADRSVMPDYTWVSYLFKKTFQKEYGAGDGTQAAAKLSEMATDLKASDGVMDMYMEGNEYAIAILTPLMKRVHTTKLSGELVFIDSSGNTDKLNTRIHLIMTYSQIGGLPLGVILTSSETEYLLTKGFQLLKSILPENSFGGRGSVLGPSVIMTDDSLPEQRALSSVWPEACYLLCIFHVLQAMWRWLWSGHNGIRKEHRPCLFQLMKELVYAATEDDLLALKHNMLQDQTVQLYPAFSQHLLNLFEKRQKWALCYRKNLMIRGVDTNNFVEAAMCIVKDMVLGRTKAFSVVQLADLMIRRFPMYYERRLLAAAYNRPHGNIPSAYSKMNIGKIKPDDICKVAGTLYEVQSKSVLGLKYHVDVSTGICSCPVGFNGAPCKHQYAVMHYNDVITIPNILNSADEVQKKSLYWLATGKHPPLDFLKPLVEKPISNDCYEVYVENSASKGPCLSESESPERNANARIQNVPAQQYTSPLESIENAEQFLENLKIKLNEMPDIYGPALIAANASLLRMKTDAAVISALHNFGKEGRGGTTLKRCTVTYATQRRGPKIAVQPTAIARRTLPACGRGKTRQFAGRPSGGNSKRVRIAPHDLAMCVRRNVSLGKTHSKK